MYLFWVRIINAFDNNFDSNQMFKSNFEHMFYVIVACFFHYIRETIFNTIVDLFSHIFGTVEKSEFRFHYNRKSLYPFSIKHFI